jgi:endogenous inhibitor of DNA gyrase (YacG/DUF329 family)
MTAKRPKEKVIEVRMMRHIPLERKLCPQCGKSFEGAKLAQFCSKSCANKASYQRHAETARTKRMAKYYSEKKAAAGKK